MTRGQSSPLFSIRTFTMQVMPTSGGTCTANRSLQKGCSGRFSRSDARLQRFAANVVAKPSSILLTWSMWLLRSSFTFNAAFTKLVIFFFFFYAFENARVRLRNKERTATKSATCSTLPAASTAELATKAVLAIPRPNSSSSCDGGSLKRTAQRCMRCHHCGGPPSSILGRDADK